MSQRSIGSVLEPIMWPAVVVMQEGFIIAAEFGFFIIHGAMPYRARGNVGLYCTLGPVDRSKGLLARVVGETRRELYWRFGLASLAILIFGVILVISAEQLAVQTGLGTRFVGATLLAGATSLPELSTTVMAVRLHSYTMAISNIFGSNLIMILLILPADVVYNGGPLLQQVDAWASFALICGIAVTAIYVVGLVVRGSHRFMGMGYDSAAVLAVYVFSLGVLYALR